MNRNSDTMGAPVVPPYQWERRRYEIAREIMANCFHEDEMRGVSVEYMALCAVQAADELIKEGKTEKEIKAIV